MPFVLGGRRPGAYDAHRQAAPDLSTETVEGTTLSLESVDDVHGGDGLPLGVFGVGDGVTDHVLQENFEHTTSLLVDETGNTLYTTSTSQTTDSGLGDALDVITKYLAMTLGSALSESLSSFTTARHDECIYAMLQRRLHRE